MKDLNFLIQWKFYQVSYYMYDLDNVLDELYDLDNVLDELYDQDNVLDELYNTEYITKIIHNEIISIQAQD